MFSLPWSKPKPERFSLDNLKLLCKQLQSFPPDARKEPIITCLKELTQILIWGDQHDPLLLEHFFEQGVHWRFLEILQGNDDGGLIVQVLQTLNIMFENVRSRESLYFLLSNNYVNQVICLRYDFSNDEVLAYYIYLLRTLSFKLSKDTINFFFNEHLDDFPLYSEAIKFFNHEESMIRIAVRVITLNVYGVDDQQMQDFILDRTTTTYFSNLVWFIGNYGTTINDILLHPSEGEMSRVDYYLAEHIDCFYYINDIVELEAPKINKILISFVLNRLLRPIYMESLLPSAAQSSSNPVRSAFASPKLSPTVVLSLLLHAFHVLKYAPLVSALATAIFANQHTPSSSSNNLNLQPVHPLREQQQTTGLSPGSSRSSSPASTSRMYSPLLLFGSSPSSNKNHSHIHHHHHHPHHAKEPALVFPSNSGTSGKGHATTSRRSSFTDSPTTAAAITSTPTPPPSNLYKAEIFGYLSLTENDRLVLPTLLLIYLACRNTGVIADVLMATDIYPQRLLKSRMLMGNLMSSSSLFGSSGTGANTHPTVPGTVPMARGLSSDSLTGIQLGGGGHQSNSLLHTMSSHLNTSVSSPAITTGMSDTGGAGGIGGAGRHLKSSQALPRNIHARGRTTRTETPLFENSDEDEESRETEELLAGSLAHDIPLPPSSPNPSHGGGNGNVTLAGDAKSPPSSRALSIRSHLSSSSLASHLPMPQLPSPKIRQTPPFFFPSTASTATAQAAAAALGSTTSMTATTTADLSHQQDVGESSRSPDHTTKGSSPIMTVPATATAPVSSSSQASIITYATMGGASVAGTDATSLLADDNTTTPSSPGLDSKDGSISTTMDTLPAATTAAAGGEGQENDVGTTSQPLQPPPLPPRQGPHDDDDLASSSCSLSSRLPLVQNREDLIQRLLDIVTCVGRKASPSTSSHRFRIVTIQVAAELMLEFVYVKGGVPAGNGGLEAKRRASSSATPSVASSFSSTSTSAPAPLGPPLNERVQNSSGGHHTPLPPRLYENMLTEEQMHQLLEAETYFRDRVRRGIESLTQQQQSTYDKGSPIQTSEFQPMGVKTMDVERAIQQTKLGLDKKVAGMLGDSKLLYGPPPDGDPDVDLDPDQVNDILANINLTPPPATRMASPEQQQQHSSASSDKESLGRSGRKTARHLSLDRQQGNREDGSGRSTPAALGNNNNTKRGRSISRHRLTAFMEDLGGIASGNKKALSAASLLSSSITSAKAAASPCTSASADSSHPSGRLTGYGSANAKLSARERLEKRVVRSIQWLHILVQVRQLLSHSRNVWSAPIFAGASFGSMTSPSPVSALGSVGGTGGGGHPTINEKGSSVSFMHPLEASSQHQDQAMKAGEKKGLSHRVGPLENEHGSAGGGSNTGETLVPSRPALTTTTSNTTVLAEPFSTVSSSSVAATDPLSHPSSSVTTSSSARTVMSRARQTLVDPLMSVAAATAAMAVRRDPSWGTKSSTAPAATIAEEMAPNVADNETEKKKASEKDDDDEEEEQQASKDAASTRAPAALHRPTHRLSLAQGSSALLKSAAPPALVSPSIMLSPPMVSPSIFATNGGILDGRDGRGSGEQQSLLSSSAPPTSFSRMADSSSAYTHGGHERSASNSTAESTMATTTEHQQEAEASTLPPSIFDTGHPWHQKDDQVLRILGSLGFFGTARSTSSPAAYV